MKFLRLTSVLLCCALLSSFLTLSASAADDMDYYSLPPVGGGVPSTAFLYPVDPAATGDGWTSADSDRLCDIWQALTDSSSGNAGSIAYCVWWIWNYIKDDIRSSLGNIDRNTSVTASRILDTNSLLGSINTAVSGIDGYATENTLSSFSSAFSFIFAGDGDSPGLDSSYPFHVYWLPTDSETGYGVNMNLSFRKFIAHLYRGLMVDSFYKLDGLDSQGNPYSYTGPTLYRMVKLLQETLASEDDRQLAENYKENRKQAEQDFLSGKSGKTSLGKDDFGSLSSVGGTFKDTISLNGQSSLSDLTSGLADADTTGQGWFSQATKDSLDAVSGSGSSEFTVSTFSDDGLSSVDVDSDPYHMQGFEDNYAWLWGDDDG